MSAILSEETYETAKKKIKYVHYWNDFVHDPYFNFFYDCNVYDSF